MADLLSSFVSTVYGVFVRLPGAVVTTATWGWHHPGAVCALAMLSLAAGAYTYVSARFHRPKER